MNGPTFSRNPRKWEKSHHHHWLLQYEIPYRRLRQYVSAQILPRRVGNKCTFETPDVSRSSTVSQRNQRKSFP